MTAKLKQLNLVDRLLNANVVCRDCGLKYGKYSVGCSSVWMDECDVCGEHKSCTEVRDYGYLQKGIDMAKGTIKEQSKKVADYLLTVGPDGSEPEASYEQGEITCKFTEEEIGFLNECLDTIVDYRESLQPETKVKEDIVLFESIEKKITDLYADYCVKYELSPALKAYYEKYGSYGTESELEMARWEGFRDAFEQGKTKETTP